MQFIPIVERLPDGVSRDLGLKLASPPGLHKELEAVSVTPWTVDPEGYGVFFINVFEAWVRHDVGDIFVMNFEWALSSWMYGESPACFFSRRCGRAVIIEHKVCVPLRLPRRVPETPVRESPTWRTGSQLPLQSLQEVLPPYQLSLQPWSFTLFFVLIPRIFYNIGRFNNKKRPLDSLWVKGLNEKSNIA